jgi:hypothetical protein
MVMNHLEDHELEDEDVPTVRLPTTRPPAAPSAGPESRRPAALETFRPPKVVWSRARRRGSKGRRPVPRVFPPVPRGQ